MRIIGWIVSLLLASVVGAGIALRASRDAVDPYDPQLESDPAPPAAPEWALRDFQAFRDRLRNAVSQDDRTLLLEADRLALAEAAFKATPGVPENVRLDLHRGFFEIDPEAVVALSAGLPTLEHGFALFQQNCATCHGVYGRGDGPATRGWLAGNYPRNFWYGRYKNRSTAYGTVPTDGDLYRTITRGMYGGAMPSFRHLSSRDRWSLVQVLKTLATYHDDSQAVRNAFVPQVQPIETSAPTPATDIAVTRGRALFIEQGCVSCHQETGAKPTGLYRADRNFTWYDEMDRPIHHSRDLTRGVFRVGAAPSDLFRLLTAGANVGPMPTYATVPAADRWAIVHYLRSLYRPEYPQALADAESPAAATKN